MTGHGLKPVRSGYSRIRLRKTPPAATLAKLAVNPFKHFTWHETLYGQWEAGIGTPVIGEADRKGQFWSEGPDPHSVWVVPLSPAPWERQDGPAKPVCLYDHGNGQWSADWSKAKSDRRDANRRARKVA